MSEKELEISVIVEYLKSLRDEIHLRIQEHTRLVWIKTIALGGMISFLVVRCYESTTSNHLIDFLYYVVWIVPFAAVVFDILIASNLRVINNLGYYIKIYIEGEAFDEIRNQIKRKLKVKNLFEVKVTEEDGILVKTLDRGDIPEELREEFKAHGFLLSNTVKVKKEGEEWEIVDEGRKFIVQKEGELLNVKHLGFGFWEEKAAQAAQKYHCYTKGDIFVVWFFTFISGAFPILFACLQFGKIIFNWWTCYVFLVISAIGVSLALCLLYRSITMERRF